MDRVDPVEESPRRAPRPRRGWWWRWRQGVLDPLWHLTMAVLVPGAWVPPVWTLVRARRVRRGPR